MKRIAVAGLVLAASLPAFAQEPFGLEGQVSPRPKPPSAPGWVDFGDIEVHLRGGYVLFSEDYEADPEPAGGVLLRLPLPRLSDQLLPWKGDLGIFVEATFSILDRESEPAPLEPEDSIHFISAGIDAPLLQFDGFRLQAQIGLQYGDFGRVTRMENGIAFLAGLRLEVDLLPGLAFTLEPEIALGDRNGYIVFALGGVRLEF